MRRTVRIPLAGPFQKESGHCFIAWRPELAAYADAPDRIGASSLILYEDGRPLGPAASVHADIRENGGGRFSHWKQSIYFAPSDNSDPNENRRGYEIELSVEEADALMVADGTLARILASVPPAPDPLMGSTWRRRDGAATDLRLP